jgi:hypothetical protein
MKYEIEAFAVDEKGKKWFKDFQIKRANDGWILHSHSLEQRIRKKDGQFLIASLMWQK